MLVKLKDIGKIVTGKTPSKKEAKYWNTNDIPFVKPDDFTNDASELKDYNSYISEFGSKKANKIPKNSVLVTCIGTIGKVVINDREVTTNQQINAIIPNENINSKYLMYQLLQKKEYLKHIAHAPVVPIINKSTFEKVKILLLPLPQQKTIAQTLDKAKELIALRKESIEKLDVLAKSLFVDMFGDPVENEMGWEVVKLENVIKIDAPMVQPNTPEYENLYLIGSDRISKNTGKILPAKKAKEDKVISKKFLFDDRYVLYSKIRPYLNKVAIANFTGLCSADMYPLRPLKNKINKEFLWQLLLAKHFLNYTETLPDRASIPKLNRKELLDYEFPLPNINIQQKFAKIIQKIETQKALYEKELVKLEENFEALLAKSFA